MGNKTSCEKLPKIQETVSARGFDEPNLGTNKKEKKREVSLTTGYESENDEDNDYDLDLEVQKKSYLETCDTKLTNLLGNLIQKDTCRLDYSLESNGKQNADSIGWVFLPSGGKIRKRTIKFFLMRNIFTHQYYGEVSFLHPRQKHSQEGMLKVLELLHPLTFIRSVGTQRKEASEEISAKESYTKFLVIIREINMWTRSLAHYQATLIYAAAEFLESSPYIAEYLGIIIFAVVSERIKNFPELEAFLEVIKMANNGQLSWHDIMEVFYEDLKISDMIMRENNVARTFNIIMRLAITLSEEDDELQTILEESLAVDPECPSQVKKYMWHGENPALWLTKRKIRVLDDLKTRRAITLKEMTHQACIFANYVDRKLSLQLPLIAHMVSRGYFSHHSQIAAATDYIRPICGIRRIMMQEVLDVVRKIEASNNAVTITRIL